MICLSAETIAIVGAISGTISLVAEGLTNSTVLLFLSKYTMKENITWNSDVDTKFVFNEGIYEKHFEENTRHKHNKYFHYI